MMRLPQFLSIAALSWFLPTGTFAAITVNGISDEDIENDSATFDVPSEAGFTIVADLNGEAVALGASQTITTPGYYELSVTKTEDATGNEESEIIQFIVLDSERGTSERGLINWIPYPTIDSASSAIDQGTLETIIPPSLPVGMPIPLIAWLRDGGGSPARLNGTLEVPEIPGTSVRLLRGVGSGLLPASTTTGPLTLTPSLHSLTNAQNITIEEAPTWTEINADIAASATWPANSRVHITTNISIPAGVTLTIESGTIVQVAPDVQIDLEGSLVITGSRAAPIFFTPEPGSGPWGGFFARATGASVTANGAIFTGSGADDNWFDPPGFNFSSHRDEQATFAFSENTTGDFTDSYFLDLAGQALHGDDATINLTGCVIQRVITVGQFNGGAITVRESALIEFPINDGIFADDDNDGIYFTRGSHQLIDSLIGWAKDDGVDAGSGNEGDVTVTRCWFEACYHEAMAWSGEIRDAAVSDSVVLNSGQGIEAGFSGGSQSTPGNDPSPEVTVTNALCIGNHVGLRYGDNYDWDYWGQLNVSNSISIHNDRDVWGFEWDSWNYRDERMDLQNNKVTQLDPRHPGNTAWDPAGNGSALASFRSVTDPAAGAGILVYEFQQDIAAYGEPVALGLSEFTTGSPSIDYAVIGKPAGGSEVNLASGTLQFSPGELRQFVNPPDLAGNTYSYIRVSVSNPTGCEITTPRHLFYVTAPIPVGTPDTLVASGSMSIWSYLDDGSDQGTAWRENGFDDSSWATGGAQLGYGDDDEETLINSGPSDDVIPTYYFRQSFDVPDPTTYATLDLNLLRDDGAIVYINGVEVFRSNMPSGSVAFDDYAQSTTSSEATIREATVPASVLQAGANVVAVEVHQANPDSSDVSFDLEIIANPAVDPLLELITLEGESALLWQGEGWELQASSDLAGDWETMSGVTSPIAILPAPQGSPPRRFYRLAR